MVKISYKKAKIGFWIFFYQRSMLFLLVSFTRRHLWHSNLCVYSFISCAFLSYVIKGFTYLLT